MSKQTIGLPAILVEGLLLFWQSVTSFSQEQNILSERTGGRAATETGETLLRLRTQC